MSLRQNEYLMHRLDRARSCISALRHAPPVGIEASRAVAQEMESAFDAIEELLVTPMTDAVQRTQPGIASLPKPETMLTYASILEKPQYIMAGGYRQRIATGEVIEAACAALPVPDATEGRELGFLCPRCGARGTTDGKASTVSSTNHSPPLVRAAQNIAEGIPSVMPESGGGETIVSGVRTCATCHAVLADGPQPAATYSVSRPNGETP